MTKTVQEMAEAHASYFEMSGYVSDPTYTTMVDPTKYQSYIAGYKQCESDKVQELAELKAKVSDLDLEYDKFNKKIEWFKEQVKNSEFFKEVVERGELISNAELLDRSQEAAHYNWLDDQNVKLEQELEDYKNPAYCPVCRQCGIDDCCSVERCIFPTIKSAAVKELKEDIESKDQTISELKLALEFYADAKNWLKFQVSRFVGGDGSWIKISDTQEEYIGGGKLARQTLQALKDKGIV